MTAASCCKTYFAADRWPWASILPSFIFLLAPKVLYTSPHPEIHPSIPSTYSTKVQHPSKMAFLFWVLTEPISESLQIQGNSCMQGIQLTQQTNKCNKNGQPNFQVKCKKCREKPLNIERIPPTKLSTLFCWLGQWTFEKCSASVNGILF